MTGFPQFSSGVYSILTSASFCRGFRGQNIVFREKGQREPLLEVKSRNEEVRRSRYAVLNGCEILAFGPVSEQNLTQVVCL